ncbi:MAG: hypothetical protein JWR69_3436 [Pedosphaera sp.]|nr:hypothetical protein [Pedosphaera sp.]
MDAESLRGKVVILEFWATWCGPCVAAIPHLNELAEQFKDQSVQFIAITSEAEATIKPFIKKRPIKALVALDTDQAMNKAYHVVGIPHTIVLDKNGRIAAITYPTALTAQHIQDLLAGKHISLPEQRANERPATGQGADEEKQALPLFEAMVRPSLSTNRSGVGGGGRFTARGYTVWDLLPRAFDQPFQSPVRLLINAPLPEGRFDFSVIQTPTPGQDQNAQEKNVAVLLQQILRSAFGLTGRKETREVEVLILKVKNSQAPGLVVSPTPGGASTSGLGSVEGTEMSISTVAAAVERSLNRPVFDETGLTNRYDISLKWDQETWDKPNPEGLRKALEDRLGLALVPDKRPVEMMVIEGAQKLSAEAGK